MFVRSTTRVCDRSVVGIAGSNPAGGWMSVSRKVCALSGRGLCDGPEPRPQESCRMCRVCLETKNRKDKRWKETDRDKQTFISKLLLPSSHLPLLLSVH